MRSKFSSAMATLVLTSASCEAFLVPAFTLQGSSTNTPTGTQSSRSSSVSMEVRAKPEVGEADIISSSDSTVSSYPGPVIPRVGGTMPEKRPGWFRVPAPGGKDSKVCVSSLRAPSVSITSSCSSIAICSFHVQWRGIKHRASSMPCAGCSLET